LQTIQRFSSLKLIGGPASCLQIEFFPVTRSLWVSISATYGI